MVFRQWINILQRTELRIEQGFGGRWGCGVRLVFLGLLILLVLLSLLGFLLLLSLLIVLSLLD